MPFIFLPHFGVEKDYNSVSQFVASSARNAVAQQNNVLSERAAPSGSVYNDVEMTGGRRKVGGRKLVKKGRGMMSISSYR